MNWSVDLGIQPHNIKVPRGVSRFAKDFEPPSDPNRKRGNFTKEQLGELKEYLIKHLAANGFISSKKLYQMLIDEEERSAIQILPRNKFGFVIAEATFSEQYCNIARKSGYLRTTKMKDDILKLYAEGYSLPEIHKMIGCTKDYFSTVKCKYGLQEINPNTRKSDAKS